MCAINLFCNGLCHNCRNSEFFAEILIESPNCICGEEVEDPYHYFFIHFIWLYTAQRAALHAAVAILAPVTLKTILSGCTALDYLLQKTKKFIMLHKLSKKIPNDFNSQITIWYLI